jgi:hypothetical protein
MKRNTICVGCRITRPASCENQEIVGEMFLVETPMQGGNFPGCKRSSQSDDQVNHGES